MKFDKIKLATNNAINSKKNKDLNKFNAAISELREIDYDRKSALIDLICNDFDHDTFSDTLWIDNFLLNDIEKSEDINWVCNAFLSLLNIGKNHPTEYHQKLVLSIIERFGCDNSAFYKLRQCILNERHFDYVNCVPVFYKIEGHREFPQIEISNWHPVIDLNFNSDKNEVEIKDAGIEFTHDEINEAIKENTLENELILDLFFEEENLYRSYIKSDNHSMEDLESIKTKSSKAWYLLLKSQQLEIKDFF